MTTTVAQPPQNKSVARIEVHPKQGQPDPHAAGLLKDAQTAFAGLSHLGVSRVYLIESELDSAGIGRITSELLTDPVNQTAILGASPSTDHNVVIEVHYQPGVMDPVAQSTQDAIAEMLSLPGSKVQVRTGFRYDLHFAGADYAKAAQEHARAFAQRFLANTVIQHIYEKPFSPDRFPQGGDYQLKITSVPFVDLDTDGLIKMSREAHLFLSLDEMQAIQNYYRRLSEGSSGGKREPRDIELETLAQTWSEHCVHKTLKATVRYTEPTPGISIPSALGPLLKDRPGHELNADGSVTINNLLKSTVAAATFKLMKDEPAIKEWCISVFKDNSGIVKFDDEDAVCIKVETHNHPSAIEPYGGAATGIGGCIRDVMGTGLGARPIANTNVFCTAFPDTSNLPQGVIHPKRVLQQVVAGVRDYGNRMGIPTINGAVAFHPDYLANPLVFAGCIGLIPLDKCFGASKPGDRIIAVGGRTGRDGIHGATFSSAELTNTHADEFAHAVQIGNAITQKKTLDALLQARDQRDGPLYSGMTDCGAGGFSSAVGEMGKDLGAKVDLERAPLKYQGLSYTEVWISEAQERMVLAVPPEKLDRFLKICADNDVEACDLGQFGHNNAQGKPALALHYKGTLVGELEMHFLHDGIPTPTRSAKWQSPLPQAANALNLDAGLHKLKAASAASVGQCGSRIPVRDMLLSLLKHPNIASKHWIIRQYDHEVQAGSVVKPLVGLKQDGPSDASVVRPKLTSNKGIAVGCGLQTGLSEKTLLGDSYWMTLAAIDEAVRNVVCVGADPSKIAILDNFCWPRCDNPHQFGSLVRAAQACYDGALAYKTPFVSGKDSLSNQFTTSEGKLITIPQTLLITALGIVPDVMKARTMDAKSAGNLLIIVGLTGAAMGGSHASQFADADVFNPAIPKTDLIVGPRNAKAVAALIQAGLIASAHDCSEGGMLTAAAEMAFAGGIGLDIDLEHMPAMSVLDDGSACFSETPSRYLLEVAPSQVDQVIKSLKAAGVAFGQLGRFSAHQKLNVRCSQYGKIAEFTLEELKATWQAPLDW
jgi:phosphoribosylformylglycinamidine synthase subunit PurSL